MPDIIYGINPVAEILKRRPSDIKRIFLAHEKGNRSSKALLDLAQRERVAIEFKERQALEQLAHTTHHQGVIAIVIPRRETGIDIIIAAWRTSGEKLLALILDGIQDPQNLGALVRSACAAGAHGVITLRDRSSPVTGAVYKASAGAVEHIPVVSVVNIAHAIDFLKARGAWVAGTSADGRQSIFDLDGTVDLALVIGSEGRGIRPLVAKKCDFLMRIPLKGSISSLNASAAGAIALYEIVRQRHHQKGG
jgi:23S rRNA (guanosine2251-2'-O)-methyltransferase